MKHRSISISSIISLSIHAGIALLLIFNVLNLKEDLGDKKIKGQPKTLIVTLIEKKEQKEGLRKDPTLDPEDAQAETFQPDDSCAWDSEEARKRYEEYLREQEEGLQ